MDGTWRCANHAEVELDQIDFVEALVKRAEPADVAWCGLSIHHLSTKGKLRLFEAIHRSTKDFLMIYEPTLAEGEDRDGYLARFVASIAQPGIS